MAKFSIVPVFQHPTLSDFELAPLDKVVSLNGALAEAETRAKELKEIYKENSAFLYVKVFKRLSTGNKLVGKYAK